MSPPDKRPSDTPGPAQMRIRLKYADVQTFVEKFAANVSRQGIFIPSKTPKPVDTLVRFELLLSDGTTKLLKGEGTVTWIREFDPANPTRAHGMGVRFTRLDTESRRLIDQMEAWKRERGATTSSTPVPSSSPPIDDEPSRGGNGGGGDGGERRAADAGASNEDAIGDSGARPLPNTGPIK